MIVDNVYERHLRSLIAYYKEEYIPSNEVEDFVEGVSAEEAAVLSGKPQLLEELNAALAAYGEKIGEQVDPYDEYVASMTEEQRILFGL
jgi:hypothetical protein